MKRRLCFLGNDVMKIKTVLTRNNIIGKSSSANDEFDDSDGI